MSANVKIIKNPFEESKEVNLKVKNNTCVKDVEGFDPENSVVYVNGKHQTSDYVLKSGDACVIRQYPSAVTATTLATWAFVAIMVTVGLGVGEAITVAVTGKGFKEHLKDWLMPKTNTATNKEAQSITQLPSLRGAKNQSALGKSIPLILGKTYFTPYILGGAYNTISGTDGEDEYYHALYLIGYHNLKVEDVGIGLEVLAENKTSPVNNGALAITSTKYPYEYIDPETHQVVPKKSYYTQIELQQGENEVSIYNCKVVQENFNAELLNAGGTATPFYFFSARYPKKVEIEFTLGGLIAYNDKGDAYSPEVKVVAEYSLDGGETWLNCSSCIDFEHATGDSKYVAPVDSATVQINYTYGYGTAWSQTFDSVQMNIDEAKTDDIKLQYYKSNGDWVDLLTLSAGSTTATGVGLSMQQSYSELLFRLVKSTSTSETFKCDYPTGTKTISLATAEGYILFKNQKSQTLRYVLKQNFINPQMETCDSKVVSYRIKRINAKSTDTKVVDKIYVTAVRTWCYDKTKTAKFGIILQNQIPMNEKERNKTARLGFSIKVTEDLVNSFDTLNLIATSKARTWDSQTHKWSTTLNPTSNPVALTLHAMTGDFRDEAYRYEIKDSSSTPTSDKIDLEDFGAKYEICEEYRWFNPITRLKRYSCDGVVLNATKSVDLANNILKCCRSNLVLNGKKYGIFMDMAQDLPLLVLNNNNLLSLTYSRNFDEIPDGQQVKYISKANYYQQDTIVVKPYGSAGLSSTDKLETVEYPFITDPFHAKAMSLYQQACKSHRPESFVAKVTGEGGLAEVGSLVSIQSDVVLVGIGDGAEITELVTSGDTITGIKTDGRFAVTDTTKEYGVVINIIDTNGQPKILRVKLAPFSATGTYSELTFNTVLDSTTPIEEGDIISFGHYLNETLETLCTSKAETGDGTYDLTLVNYDPDIYNADTTVIDDFDPKVTPPSESGMPISYGDKTTPATLTDLNAVRSEIQQEISYGDDTPPSAITGLTAVAKQDRISIYWNPPSVSGQNNNIKRYYVEIKRGSASWASLPSTDANSTEYIFNRNSDGYPEYSVLDTWKVRVKAENIYGVLAEDWTVADVNTNSYGTWIPASLSFDAKIPDEGGITFSWSRPTSSISGRTLYGTPKYTVTVKYTDTDHSVAEQTMATLVTNGLTAKYNFNRASGYDGYPEKVATATYRGLDKYTFIISVENESEGTPVSSTAVTFSQSEVNNYKTWIPSAPTITKKLAEENGISFEWNDTSDCYGNNSYSIVIPDAEGSIPLSLGATRFYYTFLRESGGVVKDGYPEPDELIDWSFTVKAVNNQTGRQSTGSVDYVDVSEYLGWLPNAPVVQSRSSGRTCTVSPANAERRYGKIMYKIMICNPAIDREEEEGEVTYKYYLPTPTADPFGAETNYKNASQENIPILSDSPYSQTMPLKDQSATKFKKYSFVNADDPLDYDNGTTKLLIYTETQPPVTATQNDVYIDGVLIEDAYCWTDSGTNFISFEVSMPSPKDTMYWWKIASYNAVTESLQSKTSAYTDAQTTAFATSAFDVVKAGITENALAPDAVTTDKIAAGTITANKIFVEALSAISANLGAITDGSLVGNANNYWYLSDEYDEQHQLIHRAGDFRVGGATGDFISCSTSNGTDYNIEIQASQFNITAIGTVVKGAFYVAPFNATIDPATGIPSSYYARIDSNGVSISGNASIEGNLSVIGISRVKHSNSDTDANAFLTVNPTSSESAGTPAQTMKLKGSIAFDGRLNTINIYSFNTPDYTSYVLIQDISKWYNSTSSSNIQSWSMNGVITAVRPSGFDASESVILTLSVGWYRNGSSLPTGNLENVKSFSLKGEIQSCILRYNSKEYLALKITNDQAKSYYFVGRTTSAPLFTNIDSNASVTELYNGNVTMTGSVTANSKDLITSGGVADYIKSGDRYNSISDCNSATKNGIYYFQYAQNCPPASLGFRATDSSGTLVVQRYDGNWVNQICQDFYGNGALYIRSCKGGTWTDWTRLIKNTDVTDTVASGNSNLITSNAVAKAFSWQDITSSVTLTNGDPNNWSITDMKCFMQLNLIRIEFKIKYLGVTATSGSCAMNLASNKFSLDANISKIHTLINVLYSNNISLCYVDTFAINGWNLRVSYTGYIGRNVESTVNVLIPVITT